MNEREEFEAWWPTVGQTLGKVAAWEAWQAALASRAPVMGELYIAPCGATWEVLFSDPDYDKEHGGDVCVAAFDTEPEARDYLAKCGQQSPAVGQEAVAYRYRFREGDWRVALDPLCDDEITDGWNQQALGVIGTPTPSRQEIEDVKDKRIAELEASLLAAQADSRRLDKLQEAIFLRDVELIEREPRASEFRIFFEGVRENPVATGVSLRKAIDALSAGGMEGEAG